ncbi:hypothetical protein DFA_04097 [Cavenderia fasciculata]|uniref:IPT/TIG domain-containing protein n=1 Tax=Cavenderia fasciculata TaxID=261658 RepID=F4Q1A2_CACFS|nr:uncharacterized protein DFA_04097 [Cavenderia fasciculata]EGG18603.1 hypothetical protein DFA_04097 [Cavenderia fasciculata]|eukprot:XP_004366507.1 hypothetical protein DFA_04097 [Cavenderia fasciculata]
MIKVICLVLTILCLSTISLVSSFTFTLQQVKDTILITPSIQLTINARIYDTLNQEITANCTGSTQVRTCRLGNIPSGLITITDGLDSATTPITLAPYITFVSGQLTTYADNYYNGPVRINGKFFEPNYSYKVNYLNGYTNHSDIQVPTSNTTFAITTGYIGIGTHLNVSVTKFNSSVSVVSTAYNTSMGKPFINDQTFNAKVVNAAQGILYLSNLCNPADCGDNAVTISYYNQSSFQSVTFSREFVTFFISENWSFGNVQVKVADQVSNNLFFSPLFANTALITDIQPHPFVQSGNVTITGRFLKETDYSGNNPWKFMIEKSSNNNTQVLDQYTYLSNQYPYVIELYVPPGTAPSISSVSKLNYQQAGKIIIEGDEFDETNLLVTIGSTECTNATIEVSVSRRRVVCYFDAQELPTNQAKTLPVVVQVDGLVSVPPGSFSYIGGEGSTTTTTTTTTTTGASDASTNTPIHLFVVAILVLLLIV